MNKYLYYLFFVFIFLPLAAHSEVLDKFGCSFRSYPSVIKYLLFFAFCILGLLILKRRVFAIRFFFLSLLFIIISELYPFLASIGFVDIYFGDTAKLSYFKEANLCPQYQKLSYWQQVWLSIGIYSLISIFFIVTRKSNKS